MNFKSCYRLCGVVINIFDSNTVYHWLYSQLGKPMRICSFNMKSFARTEDKGPIIYILFVLCLNVY
jgi:hypothetical protein